jgi:hypothetical protein
MTEKLINWSPSALLDILARIFRQLLQSVARYHGMRKDPCQPGLMVIVISGGNPEKIIFFVRSSLAWTALTTTERPEMTRSIDRSDTSKPARRGRPKADLPGDATAAVVALKRWLRTQVGDVPLKTVAQRSNYSLSTVSTVLGGSTVPPLRQVLSVAEGVHASRREAHELWYAAALEGFTATLPAKPCNPLVEFGIDLRKTMLRNDIGAGQLHRSMELASSRFDGLADVMSRATLDRLLGGSKLPTSIVQMDLLFEALNLPKTESAQFRLRYRVLCAALAMMKSWNGDPGRAA